MNIKQLKIKEIVDFEVTPQDYEKSSKNFSSNSNCPLAVAAKRYFGVDDLAVGTNFIGVMHEMGELGRLQDKFGYDEFEIVKKGKTFKTKLEVYE